MGILTWLAANWRLVGAGLFAVALVWGGSFVKGKFDRAAQADVIERQATADAATAKAAAAVAAGQLKALNDKAQQDAADRQAADARVHEREEGYVSIIATLKQRSAAASPRAAACNYGPDAVGVLNDAWTGAATNGVRNAAGAPDRSAPASAAAGGPQHQP